MGKVLGEQFLSAALIGALNMCFYGIVIVLVLAVGFALAGARVAVWIAPDGSASIEGLGPEVGMMIPVAFALDPGTHHAEARSLGISDAQIRNVRASLRFPPKPGFLLAANWALVIGLLILALWVLHQLRALFRTLRDGQPFLPINAARVQRIGWAVVIGELARSAIVFFENCYALAHFSIQGLRLEAHWSLNFFVILNGLVILVIAEVFRQGTRLDEEQALTI